MKTEQQPTPLAAVPLSSSAGVDLEYKSLRDEILLRINLRQQLLSYTLALSAALVGVGLQSPRVALLYPPFAFFLALGWMQNDYRVRNQC